MTERRRVARSREVDIAAYMLSCPEREAAREATLCRLRASDWGAEPVLVLNECTGAGRPDCHERGSLAVLRHAAQEGRAFVLFLEDDLDFNRHLRRNLCAWRPLLVAGDGERPFFASLYNPVIRALWRDEARAYLVADPDAIYGSQAFLLSRATVRDVLSHWAEVPGMGDIKISRVATRRCPAHYHVPSLVQHVAGPSVIGGPAHHAPDFDADWTAPACAPRRGPEAVTEVALAAALRRMDGIEGWLSEEEAGLLVTSCLQSLQRTAQRGAAVVEIGSWHGRSTVVLATAADLARDGAQVVAIDPHAGELTTLSGLARTSPTFEAFRRSIARAGVDALVRPVRRRSQDVDWRDPIAFLFVDGLHDDASVRADLGRFAPAVVPGGRIAVHDYGVFDGVGTAVDAFVAAGGWRRDGAAGSLIILEPTGG